MCVSNFIFVASKIGIYLNILCWLMVVAKAYCCVYCLCRMAVMKLIPCELIIAGSCRITITNKRLFYLKKLRSFNASAVCGPQSSQIWNLCLSGNKRIDSALKPSIVLKPPNFHFLPFSIEDYDFYITSPDQHNEIIPLSKAHITSLASRH